MKLALNLPNQITLARLGLAVVFFVLLSQYSQGRSSATMLDVAAGIFIIAAVTDILDGYLARKRGQVTLLGRVLDPLVDKVLICGAFILFCGPAFVDETGHNVTEVKAWMVVVIVGRELLVTGLRGFNEAIGRSFGASVYGKVKMWMQSIAAPAILLIIAHETALGLGGAGDFIKKVLVWLTVIVTALSTVHYLVRSRHILEESAQV
jgi:CDP-diacylglycerol--glycerol-3-phosphate 3-phosphatidyltransferase